MDPSEIRRAILDDHHQLRTRLHHLHDAIEDARHDPAAAAVLRDGVLDLLDALDAHMDHEDRVLAPALLQTDAWGPWRVERMTAHHEADRARVDGLRRALVEDPLDPDAVRRAAVQLISDLQAEMADEERTLLHPDILRDDLVTSGVGG